MTTTTELTLKEQYALRKKEHEQKMLKETLELLESHVLILEQLDTGSINKIVNAMASLDTLAQKYKLQSLKTAIDNTENQLLAVVSGKGSAKDVGKVLSATMAVYDGVSDFFRNVIPWVLKLPAVRATPKDVRLVDSKAEGGEGLAPALSKTIQQSLTTKPTGILGKIMSFFKAPSAPVDAKALTAELMTLSPAQLGDLQGEAVKMPAVASRAAIDNMAASVIQQHGVPGSAQQQQTSQQQQQPQPAGAPAAGGAMPSEDVIAKGIAKIGLDKIAAAITNKNITDPAVLARLIASNAT